MKSEDDKGTLFSVYLPILEEQLPVEEILPTEILGGNECILYIDDEQSLLNYSHQTLSMLGYNVTTRDNALEALELFKAKHNKFDLVITDLTMPHMNGDDLASEFRRIRPDIAIILCSGFDARISKERIEQIGIATVINKPVLRVELAYAVRTILDKAAQHKALNTTEHETKNHPNKDKDPKAENIGV